MRIKTGPAWPEAQKRLKEALKEAIYSPMKKYTAEDFEKATGFKPNPDMDDLDRVNCEHAGEAGHHQCGWCSSCDKPRWVCGCLLFNDR